MLSEQIYYKKGDITMDLRLYKKLPEELKDEIISVELSNTKNYEMNQVGSYLLASVELSDDDLDNDYVKKAKNSVTFNFCYNVDSYNLSQDDLVSITKALIKAYTDEMEKLDNDK